ncbi:CMRF35-like molecule 7 isoform 2-T2 [Acanthopagrus schlegelii]
METVFLVLLCLLAGLGETAALSVTGVLGMAVEIKCTHANAFTNVKYFCKGKCGSEDILIDSRKKKDGRYSISDKGNTFYVTISGLTEKDSGTYWCGIDRLGLDTYHEVVLTVIQRNNRGSENDHNDSPQSILDGKVKGKGTSWKRLVYIGAGLGAVLLALMIVIVVFFRHRSRYVSKSSGKVQDTVYATPLCQRQDAHHTTTSSSTATEVQGTGDGADNILSLPAVRHQCTSKDQGASIYSNISVSSESQTQPDGLVYSTVTFNRHCDSVKPRPAVVTYSTINNISTDESTVYCNV